MHNKEKKFFWISFSVIIFVLVFFLYEVLEPLIISFIFAYLLNPIIDLLRRFNISRTLATTIIVIVFYSAVIAAMLLAAPKLWQEINNFLVKFPTYINKLEDLAASWNASKNNNFTNEFSGLLENLSSKKFNFLLENNRRILDGFLSSGMKFLSFMVNILLIPIMTFYLLKDWPKILEKIDELIPRYSYLEVRGIFENINKGLAGYIRGQVIVCILLATFYSLSLKLIGLEYGFVIGLLTGLFCFIPYIAVLTGLIVSVIIGFFQFEGTYMIWLVIGIFLFGQFIEGNFITPKLIGSKIGVHPVGIIFSLLVSTYLFGFVGILLALPCTAIIKVIIDHLHLKYRRSHYYIG